MADPRTTAALARIEQALDRIERAGARRPSGDPALAARHERLRRATAAAIAELDAVISNQNG